MSFSSLDNIVLSITSGKTSRLNGFRTVSMGATSAAGRWHECFSGTGAGGIGVLTGTAGLGTPLTNATTGALPQPSPTVSADTKSLLSLQAYTAASTLVPGVLLITDLLYMYPSCVLTTGAGTTLSNVAGKPARFNNGAGVQAACILAGTALGATTPTITTLYTNQDGTPSRSGSWTASAASLPTGCMLTSGTQAVQGGHQMALAAGDSGVRSIESYSTTSGTTGTGTFMLHRTIASIPLVAVNTAGERGYLVDMPSLPRIEDGACLAFFIMIGGTATAGVQVVYEAVTAWG